MENTPQFFCNRRLSTDQIRSGLGNLSNFLKVISCPLYFQLAKQNTNTVALKTKQRKALNLVLQARLQ